MKSKITTCMCHMIRQMGDCRLSEVVKQVRENEMLTCSPPQGHRVSLIFGSEPQGIEPYHSKEHVNKYKNK